MNASGIFFSLGKVIVVQPTRTVIFLVTTVVSNCVGPFLSFVPITATSNRRFHHKCVSWPKIFFIISTTFPSMSGWPIAEPTTAFISSCSEYICSSVPSSSGICSALVVSCLVTDPFSGISCLATVPCGCNHICTIRPSSTSHIKLSFILVC